MVGSPSTTTVGRAGDHADIAVEIVIYEKVRFGILSNFIIHNSLQLTVYMCLKLIYVWCSRTTNKSYPSGNNAGE